MQQLFLAHVRHLFIVLDQAESGVVYHIVTPRQSNPQPKDAFRCLDRYPGISEADLANRVEELLALAMLFSKNALTMRFGRALDYALTELVRRTH